MTNPPTPWLKLTIGWIALCAAPQIACALVLNDAYFNSSGGDANDVAGTLDAGYADARSRSAAIPFQAVGAFGHCTGTWIGNDPLADVSFFLTAAHCFNDSTTQTPAAATFTDYAGRRVASGAGTFHVPPERVNRPAGFGGASTDIGILVLPGQTTILGEAGVPIPRPLLYDGAGEFGVEVTFAGYGSWGIGSQGSNGGLSPSSGARRAAGTNVIDSIFEQSHGISATFNAPGTGDFTPRESAVAPGDSGSAWWQHHDDAWAIIGTTNGGSGSRYGNFSTAARVSKWIDWLQSIYPDAQLWSENALTGVAGDVNQDGFLNSADALAFRAGWFSETSHLSLIDATRQGDLNYDGRVSLEDVIILQEAFGERFGRFPSFSEVLSGNVVPEPGALAVLLGLATQFTRPDRRPGRRPASLPR